MRKLLFLSILFFGCCIIVRAQHHTNNFLLKTFTSTGFSSYDWRYEPQKTDLQRGWFKGNVVKVFTDIQDKTGTGMGDDHYADTTYYNSKGNFLRIVDKNLNTLNKLNLKPSVYTFEYDSKGQLHRYTVLSEAESHDWDANVDYASKGRTIYNIKTDRNGRMSELTSQYYSTDLKGKWEKSDAKDKDWTFIYDANGNLASGYNHMFENMKVTYHNGQLVKMQEDDFKPQTITYNANGRPIQHRYFFIDGMDEAVYDDFVTTFTYNGHGDIATVKRTVWTCNSKWKRLKIGYTLSYTFSYTYDKEGNWTKCIGYENHGKKKRTVAYVMKRQITYGPPDPEKIAATAPDNPMIGIWNYHSDKNVDFKTELNLKSKAERSNNAFNPNVLCQGGIVSTFNDLVICRLNLVLDKVIDNNEANYIVWGECYNDEGNTEVRSDIRLKMSQDTVYLLTDNKDIQENVLLKLVRNKVSIIDTSTPKLGEDEVLNYMAGTWTGTTTGKKKKTIGYGYIFTKSKIIRCIQTTYNKSGKKESQYYFIGTYSFNRNVMTINYKQKYKADDLNNPLEIKDYAGETAVYDVSAMGKSLELKGRDGKAVVLKKGE